MQELDVRWLPQPQPFETIMAALQKLSPEDSLHVHIHREPFPLYEALGGMGYTWQTTALDDGSFRILIRAS